MDVYFFNQLVGLELKILVWDLHDTVQPIFCAWFLALALGQFDRILEKGGAG